MSWQISNRYKKRCEERIFFENPEGKKVTLVTGYRLGEFVYQGEGKPDLDLESEERMLMETDSWSLDYMGEGCYSDFEFSDNVSEEERNEIIDVWEDEGFEGLERLGYEDTLEAESWLFGPFDLKEVDY